MSVEEYLKKENKGIVLNLPSAKKSLEGEQIVKSIPLNEDETFCYLKSGYSFTFTNQGLFYILSKEETKKKLNEWKELNQVTALAYSEIESLEKEQGKEQIKNATEQKTNQNQPSKS